MISRLLVTIVGIIELAILIDCVLSWFNKDSNNDFVRAIDSIVNPILDPFRSLQNKYLGNLPVDISPIFAIIALELLKKLIWFIL